MRSLKLRCIPVRHLSEVSRDSIGRSCWDRCACEISHEIFDEPSGSLTMDGEERLGIWVARTHLRTLEQSARQPSIECEDWRTRAFVLQAEFTEVATELLELRDTLELDRGRGLGSEWYSIAITSADATAPAHATAATAYAADAASTADAVTTAGAAQQQRTGGAGDGLCGKR